MYLERQLNKKRKIHRAWLYSVVFSSKLSIAVVLLLSLSFFLQPFHEALANEGVDSEQTEEPAVADEVREHSAEESEDVQDEEPNNSATEAEEESADTQEEVEIIEESETVQLETELTEENDQEAETTTATSTEDSDQSTPDVEDAEVSEVTASSTPSQATTTPEILGETDSVSTSTASTTITENATTTDDTEQGSGGGNSASGSNDENSENVEEETNEEDVNDQDENKDQDETGSQTDDSTTDISTSTVSEVATTTSETNATPEEKVVDIEYVITEDNYYQFSRQSCVAVGDGTYHCSTSEGPVIDSQAVVYADRDAGGDMEIFLRSSRGDLKQLTDNDFDDTSPHYDAESLRIVWQRLVNGRYQVILYDIYEDEETQLTFSKTNNMEPKVSDTGIVWQAWDGNDWEIMYFDGEYTEQITENDTQDVTPVIEDEYILWSILGNQNQEARVYSLASGETLTITGHDGGSIANPRFVLVYDTRFDNGDVITQGFDPITGISAPISAVPAPDPVEIPHNDPTGEIRALIQNKTSYEDEDVIDSPQTNKDSLDLNLSTSSATSSDTLNLKKITEDTSTTTDSETATSTPVTEEPFELTDFDLVLTPTTTEATEPDVIEDDGDTGKSATSSSQE